MAQSKVISAVSYLSIFFAPFILPLVLYFVIKDDEVKYHSKRAFINHLLPTVLGIILSIVGFSGIMISSYEAVDSFMIIFLVLMGIYFIVCIILMIWNVVQAVRLLCQS